MLADYLERGAAAGAAAGVVYGLFVWLVGTPLVRAAERHEAHGGGHGGSGAGAAAPAVAGDVAAVTSVLGGVVFGVLLGVLAFGLAYYLLEPSIPGGPDSRSYLLAAAGFVTVSGAPWVALPPRPPGVEAALGTDIRLGIYAGMMALGATCCGVAWLAHRAFRRGATGRAAALAACAVVPVPLAGLLVPTGVVHSPLPAALAAGFRWTVVFGQVLLWGVLATSHAWLVRRTDGSPAAAATDDAVVAAD